MRSLILCSDPQLVEFLLTQPGRRNAAWQELMRRHRRRLFHIHSRFQPPPSCVPEAQDLEGLLYCHLSGDNWHRLRAYAPRPDTPFSAWLSVVAYRLLCDRQRPEPPTVSLEDSGDSGQPLKDRLPDFGNDPLDALLTAEKRRMVRQAMARLKHPRCQEVLLRRHEWGEGYGEIAERMCLTPANARQMHSRNCGELKTLLDELGYF
ncbi:MAG: sigma-70 family RNA polymerase sigma factor [Armatimonadetes bacterium]|nr:sigma-70 family RNA polymerase sigma factor [Armatimonadota bacterium]